MVNNDFNVPDVLSKGQIISVLLQMDNYVTATLTIHEEVEVTRKFKIPELMTPTLYYSLCDRATINEKILFGLQNQTQQKQWIPCSKTRSKVPPLPSKTQ